MKKSFNLLEKKEWLGEFWVPGSNNKFAGMMKYDPRDGITISALILEKVNELSEENKILHGYSVDTGYIVLHGCFIKREGTINGYARNPVIFASYALLKTEREGGPENFDCCEFEIIGLDEFCFPQGFKSDDRFTANNVVEAQLEDCEISIYKSAVGHHVDHEKISSLFLLAEKDKKLSDDLDNSIADTLGRHSVSELWLKSEMSYTVQIKNKISLSIQQQLSYMFCVKTLFSFLMIRPTNATVLKLIKNDDENSKHIPMLHSFSSSDNVPKNQLHHHFMVVNLNGIKDSFQKVISEWHDLFIDETDIVVD